MKKNYVDVIVPLTNLSGIPWSPEHGIAIGEDTATSVKAVWDDYTSVTLIDYIDAQTLIFYITETQSGKRVRKRLHTLPRHANAVSQ